ncbi:hypothetical protein [Tunturiibacter lichenicola]|uniref:hypothetical protein n=1 Tax=Tunturiibacter lichenicola TaxID=2051959 RepID=UPI003D9BD791
MSRKEDSLVSNCILDSSSFGSGKTSLTQSIVDRVPQLAKGITVTTRVPRHGEVSGKDYHFVTPHKFLLKKQAGAFLKTDDATTRAIAYPAQLSRLRATTRFLLQGRRETLAGCISSSESTAGYLRFAGAGVGLF